MTSYFGLPPATVKSEKSENDKEEIQGDEAAPLPMELTASTALYLWYELMQRAILNGDALDSLDSLGYNFLHYAALEGNKEVVLMLLDRGVSPNIVSENHQKIMPLHWACLRAQMEVVLVLLDHRADMNMGDSEGHTPLHKAAQYGQTQLCQLLIARGCPVDQTDRHGHTALHWAAYMGKMMTIEFLLRAGAEINLRDGDSKTPLHRALQQSQFPHVDIVLLLLQKGAVVQFNAEAAARAAAKAARKRKDGGKKAAARSKPPSTGGAADAEAGGGEDSGGGESDSEEEKGADDGLDMLRICMASKGRASEEIQKLLLGSQKQSLLAGAIAVPPAAGADRSAGRKGGLQYHLAQRRFNGQHFAMYSFFLGNAINCFIVYFRNMLEHQAVWYHLHLVGFALAVIAVITYITSARMDPGFISLESTPEDKRLVQEIERTGLQTDKICSTCGIIKPIRSKHCRSSRRCVAKFDHHCPWIGNAVGYRNHPLFVTFLGSSTLAGAIFVCFAHRRVAIDTACPPVALLDIPSIFKYYWYVLWTYPHLFLTTGMTSLFTMYFLIMFVSHLRMCVKNITTNEMENAWRYAYLRKDTGSGHTFYNPFDRGVLINFIEGYTRPLFQAATGRGVELGSDGYGLSCGAVAFPNYYGLTDIDDLTTIRAPTWSEIATLGLTAAARPAGGGRYQPVPAHDSDTLVSPV